MGKKDYRTLFLKEFTKTLMMNSSQKTVLIPNSPIGIENSGRMVISIKPMTLMQNPTPQQNIPKLIIPARSQPNPNTLNLQGSRFPPSKQIIQPIIKPQIKPESSKILQSSEINSISPVPHPLPQGFTLIKIDSLIKDDTITAIECSGPGKPLIVRSLGRVSPTRISLSEEEIKKIVGTYSSYSRIPVMEGLFKAAVGNTLITAVISNFVGSTFIINKFTPYSLIERQN